MKAASYFETLINELKIDPSALDYKISSDVQSQIKNRVIEYLNEKGHSTSNEFLPLLYESYSFLQSGAITTYHTIQIDKGNQGTVIPENYLRVKAEGKAASESDYILKFLKSALKEYEDAQKFFEHHRAKNEIDKFQEGKKELRITVEFLTGVQNPDYRKITFTHSELAGYIYSEIMNTVDEFDSSILEDAKTEHNYLWIRRSLCSILIRIFRSETEIKEPSDYDMRTALGRFMSICGFYQVENFNEIYRDSTYYESGDVEPSYDVYLYRMVSKDLSLKP
jgi:hypothetical protein